MKPTDFIGKSGRIAALLLAQVSKLQAAGCPVMQRRYLFTGCPGLGKSAIAKLFAHALVSHPLGVEAVNGQSCSIERVREWTFHGQFAPMFGMRVQIVDEIDAASPAALNELRTYLDTLSDRTVFIATTNKTLAELPEQLRSRFKVQYFEPVPLEEIAAWLPTKFPRMDAVTAGSIAIQSNGNVRDAEMVALSAEGVWDDHEYDCATIAGGACSCKFVPEAVTSVRREPLNHLLGVPADRGTEYGFKEVIREGFPDMTPEEFVTFFCASHKGCTPETKVTRIEFKYV